MNATEILFLWVIYSFIYCKCQDVLFLLGRVGSLIKRLTLIIICSLYWQVKKVMQKTARRKLEEHMTEEQLQREKAVQRSQLDAINRLVSSTASLQSVNDIAQPDLVKQQLQMYIE